MRGFGIFTKSDFNYTLRLLGKRPGSTLLSVLILAFGLGLSIFTITTAYTFSYKNIPLPGGKSVVRLCTGSENSSCGPFRAFEFSEMRSEVATLEDITVSTASQVYVETPSFSGNLLATTAEWGLFPLSGVNAHIGRSLREFDGNIGSEPVVALSYDTWRVISNSDTDIVDKTIRVNGEVRKVVGVMPEGYRFPSNSQVWMPIQESLVSPLQNDQVYVTAYARLKNGVSHESASAELNNLMRRVRSAYPLDVDEYGAQNVEHINSARVSTLPMALLGGRTGLLALTSVNVLSIFIFLLVCINVGTLLLARVNERIKDVSIRTALGAPMHRLLIQTMSENVFISIFGGVLAVLLAGFFLEVLNWFLNSTLSNDIPFWVIFGVDASTILGVVIFIILTIFLTCVVPGYKILNGDFNAVLRDGTRGSLGIKAGKASGYIVVAAISLISLLLYVGALAGSTAILYKNAYSGRDVENLVGAEFSLSPDQFSLAERNQIFESVSQQLKSAGNIENALLFGSAGRHEIRMESTVAEGESGHEALIQGTYGDLQAVGSTLLEGRYLTQQDVAEGPQVAIISQSLAMRIWPGESAVDKRILVNGGGYEQSWRRVVGVVSDTIISGQSILTPQSFAAYLPLSQTQQFDVSVYVKYLGNTNQASSALRDVLSANGAEPPVQVVNFADDIDSAVKAMNSGVTLIIVCGLFALLVALTGIYGLTSNAVILRTQEIGTRRALGATDKRISKAFILVGLKQVLIGILVTTVLCLPITYLFFSSASPEYIAIALPLLFLLISALVASLLIAIYIPIRAILKMEPMEALRQL